MKPSTPTYHFLLCVLLHAILVHSQPGALSEPDRIAEYDKRYERKWPPMEYVPDTEGWKNLMEQRFQQIREIENSGEKYEGYMQVKFGRFKSVAECEQRFCLIFSFLSLFLRRCFQLFWYGTTRN